MVRIAAVTRLPNRTAVKETTLRVHAETPGRSGPGRDARGLQ